MKGKCDCWKWKMKMGICLIVLAVLVCGNGKYNWISWANFIAIVIGIWGVKKLIMSAWCNCK